MLVAIEGIDGAGKGTLAEGLVKCARSEEFSATTLSFPRYEDTRFARLIGQYLNGAFGDINAVSVHFASLLYAGDRFESRDHLGELQADCDLVVLDRYVASNRAYNGAKLPPGQERRRLIDWIADTEYGLFELPKPDLTLLLATAVDVADALVQRKAERSYTDKTRDLHEADRRYMREVAAVYAALAADADEGPWCVIDSLDDNGTLRAPDAICQEAWDLISARLFALTGR